MSWTFAYSGMTANGWIVYAQDGYSFQDLAVRTYDGGYIVRYLPVNYNQIARTITFDMWTYS